VKADYFTELGIIQSSCHSLRLGGSCFDLVACLTPISFLNFLLSACFLFHMMPADARGHFHSFSFFLFSFFFRCMMEPMCFENRVCALCLFVLCLSALHYNACSWVGSSNLIICVCMICGYVDGWMDGLYLLPSSVRPGSIPLRLESV